MVLNPQSGLRPPISPELVDPANPNEKLKQSVVKIRRVSKVVKGGRNIRFNAMVVVGDGKGRVGAALGRSKSVPEAVRKGTVAATKRMVKVPLKGTTLPHEMVAKFASSKVLLMPASPGTGIIAGGGVRTVVEAAGITDILAKRFGSSNPINIVKATFKALSKIIDVQAELKRRKGDKVEQTADKTD